MTPTPCPVCRGLSLRPCASPPGIAVSRCTSCGHRTANHPEGAGPVADYHDQYDGGAYLEALRATRVRQATQLLEMLARRVPALSAVVDYGAGRGWFLEACRDAGIAPLAGVDTSQVSVDALAARGIESLRLPADESSADVFERLSFRPRVVTFLDVVEHLSHADLAGRFRRIVASAGTSLEFVVLKVPQPGLLYAGAALLARAGAPGFLAQLYQAGTWPPHLHYFCERSARRLFAEADLDVVEAWGDPDFDPATFGARLGAAGRRRGVRDAAGTALDAAIRATGAHDALVLAGAPRRRV